jgi:hypothetical protein
MTHKHNEGGPEHADADILADCIKNPQAVAACAARYPHREAELKALEKELRFNAVTEEHVRRLPRNARKKLFEFLYPAPAAMSEKSKDATTSEYVQQQLQIERDKALRSLQSQATAAKELDTRQTADIGTIALHKVEEVMEPLLGKEHLTEAEYKSVEDLMPALQRAIQALRASTKPHVLTLADQLETAADQVQEFLKEKADSVVDEAA